jgi:hypothetical protein
MPDEQHSALLRKSEQTGVPMAQLVRQAINDFLHNEFPGAVIVSGQVISGQLLIMRCGG